MEKNLASYRRPMEKKARTRLLDAGIELLGTRGGRGATARAAEDLAGLPHGSIRHHFGGQSGFRAALTEYLLVLDAPRDGETPQETLRRWLIEGRAVTQARYEITLLATRDPHLASLVCAGRDTYVDGLVAAGVDRGTARVLVAAFDGVVLDGLLRGDAGADITPLLRAVPAEPDR